MKGTLNEILSKGPKFEENILKAFENRRLVFFIGAGVSRIMGIMGWDDFSAFLVRKAFPDFKDYNAILRDVPSSKERITVAYKKFEQEGRLSDFYKYFGQGMIPNQKVFESKENIYEILNRFEAIFLTTNADNLFEEIIGSALCHEDYNPTILKSESQRRQNHLFYLHGHYTENIDEHKNNLVFTAPQYVERYNDPDFIGFLRTIFEDDNTIVFVGYGLNEFELIDYVVTKSGHTATSPRKVYVLHPFCQNDDLLFEVKKSYFEALNIEIIPYDISKNGYDSLIDVLNALFDDYQKRTIVPITETISESIANFNDANYATIKRFLLDPNLAPTIEVQISREIQGTGNSNWIEHFCRDGLYSQKQMDIKIAYRAWPLLELFVDWVRSDDTNAQKAACTFLDQICPEQITALRGNYSFINKNIIQIILALDKNSIQDKHLDLLMEIGRNSDLFGFGLHKISTLHRVTSWDWIFISKLFDWLFEGVEIDSFRDEKAYIIELFFKQFNNEITNDYISTNVFEYFKHLLIIAAPSDKYNLFLYTHDLDHIYKNHKDYWKIVLTELTLAFSRSTLEMQKRLLSDAISNANIAVKKLGLYLARKHNHDVSDLVINSEIFNYYSLYHESYLLLENQIKNEYLDVEVQDRLHDIVMESKFEIDTYKLSDDKDVLRYNNLILSKRLALLLLFSNPKSKVTVAGLLEQQIKPYPTIEMARDCDYVHGEKWENKISMSRDLFENVPYEKWINKLNELCSKTEDDLSVSDCGVKFVQLLLSLDDDIINIVLSTLKNLSPSLQNSVLHELNINKNKLNSHTVLISSYLDILGEIIQDISANKEISKTIFALLSDVEIQDSELVQKVLSAINPWLYISIDGDPAFIGDEHVLTNLINYGDFDKFGALLNCYVARKTLLGDELKESECNLLLDLLDHDNNNKTFKYTMCYYYQRLKYLSSSKAMKIFDAIVNKEPFDMTALVLCTLNSSYLFKEITEKIESTYLSASTYIPGECKDRILSDRFYSYVISARYEDSISQDSFEKAYSDSDFVEYFLRSLSMWAQKEKFDAEKWLIPCWKHIKTNYPPEKCQESSYLMLHSVDDINTYTEPLLNMYLDIVSLCSQKRSIHIKPIKLLPFLDVNKAKAHKLIQHILCHHGFIDTKDLEVIISNYKENELSREGSELLNMLTSNGEISNKEKERIAKLLA